MHLIYLLLSSTIICNKWAVKNNSKTSSGESGTGTVGPTADWKGVMVTGCRLVVHIAGRVPGGAVVGEAPTGELTGGECDVVSTITVFLPIQI